MAVDRTIDNNVFNSSPEPLPQFSTASKYDLAIIGSGISCAYTLIHYIDRLKEKVKNRAAKTIKVVVFDKSGEFWTGVPYGSRSGKQSLIITALKEFLPQPERDRFIDWLNSNYTSILSSLKQRSGVLDRQWLDSYQEAMVDGSWEKLYIPRYIFGWYLKDRVEELLREARQQNYLQCDLVSADVCNVARFQDTYQIQFTAPTITTSLLAQKVVLAIGSPPSKVFFSDRLQTESQSSLDREILCIGNMYEPSQNSNIERAIDFLKQSSSSQPNHILIIGSNASALETIYSLNNVPAADAIDKFIVISPNAQFPHRISDRPTVTNFVPQHLASLSDREYFTAKQILAAVRQDVAAALEQNESIDSTYSTISKRAIDALNLLDFNEQKSFVTKYGVEIGKLQRRAGSIYLEAVDKLIFEGRLQLLKGKFSQIVPLATGYGFEFINSLDLQKELFTSPVKVIINCAGFSRLTNSDSPLIDNLIRQKICTPNDSLCGFEIDENFEANKNFYLMGPLVAGNINGRLKVWHAESCGRIFNFSRKLAEVLV